MAFKTFACDDEVVDGESYLRADYSISCKTSLHMLFQVYAGLMILVRKLTTVVESDRRHVLPLLFSLQSNSRVLRKWAVSVVSFCQPGLARLRKYR